MTWLTNDANDSIPPGARLAQMWREPGIITIPGAHNALSALLAKKAGFKALYLSGAALSASLAMPDLGILGLEELCLFTRAISRAAGLPLIVDADTGFGGVLNAMRAVRELEDAGAAAIQIEDQVIPKKCGHLNDKLLVSPQEMAAKIAAAVKSRRHVRIVARTDAAAVEGVDAALRRARLYLEAGADAIFPEALTDEAAFRRFAQELDAPLLANMTEFGRTPYMSASQFEALGFKMVIWPVSSLRAAAKAIEELYRCLARDGATVAMLHRMQTRAELYDLIAYSEFEALDESIAASVLPPKPGNP
jgi:methylisocitrate lyase